MTTPPTTQQAPSSEVRPAPARFSFSLRSASLILTVIGIAVSGYLSYTRLANTAIVCVVGDAFNCDVVQNSAYSKLFGIPVAYLGLATYGLLGAALLFEDRVTLLREYGPLVVFGVTLFGFLFSAWLFYVQAALLQYFCIWCLIQDVTMTLLFAISGIRLRRELVS